MINYLREAIKMAYNPNHEWWINPPFTTIYEPSFKFSHTYLSVNISEIIIYLRRRYDIIHELIHIYFFLNHNPDFSDEVIANISEALELVSLELFSNYQIMYYCT